MQRYRLFLLERPTADPRKIERAAWELPSALDVAKLTRALKGDIAVDWLEIASSDKKREIVKIQQALGAAGCMLAIDDAGGTFRRDLTDAISEALSRDGRRRSRERARSATIWQQGDGLRAIPVWLARHARALGSVAAALAVLGGSVVLLAVWMNGAPRAGGGPDPSSFERLAAFGRGDFELPAIPDMPDGDGTDLEPAEPVSAGAARPLPAAEPGAGRPAIPDVPSGGAARPAAVAHAKKPEAPPNEQRTVELSGFTLGIGWAALVELVARRSTRRSASRSRKVVARLIPAIVMSAVTVVALIAMEEHSAPVPPAAKKKIAPAAVAHAKARPSPTAARKPAERVRKTVATNAPAAPSYRTLLASLAPTPDPCDVAKGPLARFLCLERLRHPSAGAESEPEAGQQAAAEQAPVEGGAAASAQRVRSAATASAPAPATAAATAPNPPATRSAAGPAAKSASSVPAAGPGRAAPTTPPQPGTAAMPPSTPATSSIAAGAIASAPPASAPATRTAAVSPPPSPPPPPTTPELPPPAPTPPPARRHHLLAALPTFLLGLLAGTLGLAIVALGLGGSSKASAAAPPARSTGR